jgi:hypothetical protein
MNLPDTLSNKIWIPIFTYSETLEHLDIKNLPENIHIFFIGNYCSSLLIPDHSYSHIPWIYRDNFWNLIDLADISILRGEISSLR